MNHSATLTAVLTLTLFGCGGGDDAGGDDGTDRTPTEDAASSGNSGSDWCQTILDLENEFDGLEEDIDNEDFYADVAAAYRRMADGAPDGLDDDLDRVIAGFEAFNDWLQDPTSEYPLTDEEEAEYAASIDRINVAIEDECGITFDDSDEFDDSGDDAFVDDEFTDDEFTNDASAGYEFDAESGEGITQQIENDEESGTVTLGGELPDDFPLPTPELYRVGSSSVLQGASTARYSAVLHAPFEDFEPVLEMYEGFLDDEGFETTKDDISSSETDRFVFLTGAREQVTVEVVMSLTEVANDSDGNLIYETTITLAWNEDA